MTGRADVVVRGADVDGRVVDVVWRSGAVVAVDRPGTIDIPDGATVLDALGGALLPGLHDHHIHLLALAAARASVRVGPPEVRDVAGFASVLREAAAGGEAAGWVRAVGYHESVAGELDADRLDALVPEGGSVAIRVQHRSGQLWVFNRRAIESARLGDIDHPGVERDASGRLTGRVFGLDDALRDRIPAVVPDLAGLAAELAAYGVTGVTDLTPTESASEVGLLAGIAGPAGFPVAVTVTGALRLDPLAAGELPLGPVKFLPADHSAIDLDELAAGVTIAHAGGRPVAIHCVTRVGLVVALAALRQAGTVAGDRIEHGAVVPDELLGELADLGVVVVTQPNFVAERGDAYRRDVEVTDREHLWRCGSLRAAGVAVAAGTDAPFGHPDPWRAIAAAIDRRTAGGQVLGAAEAVPPGDALALFLGAAGTPARPRHIVAGAVTDLCLLDRPLADVLAEPTSNAVRATIGRAGVTLAR